MQTDRRADSERLWPEAAQNAPFGSGPARYPRYHAGAPNGGNARGGTRLADRDAAAAALACWCFANLSVLASGRAAPRELMPAPAGYGGPGFAGVAASRLVTITGPIRQTPGFAGQPGGQTVRIGEIHRRQLRRACCCGAPAAAWIAGVSQ